MPTGYTAKLMEKGQEFPAFIMSCARAFGACVTMRDDDPDAPIPEKFTPSDYNKKALIKARAAHKRLLAMRRPARLAFGKAEKANALREYRAMLIREALENARLIKMEKDVNAWQPPTSEHEGLKKFMLEQLSISKHELDYVKARIKELSGKAPMAFYVQALETAERDIEYHTKGHAEELERVEKRNDWVAKLRASVAA